jgi:hypothetical protein
LSKLPIPKEACQKVDTHERQWVPTCRNLIFGVFGIFLAKKSFQSSKFSEGIFFTWPLFSHFVEGAG